MTVPTSTYQTYTNTGSQAEDVQNIIYRVSQEETPFLSRAKRSSVEATYHEWQTEAIDTVDTANKQVEGDEYSLAASTYTTKVGNHTQISNKVYGVSHTQQAVKKHGYKDEMRRQKLLKGIALKRDMENTLLGNQASSAGNASTARALGGLESWLTTNVSRGSGGSNGGFSGSTTTAATDGTQRVFTEDLFKSVLKLGADTGANFKTVLVNSFNKQKFSSFSGNATRTTMADNKLSANITLYESDFGQLQVVFSPQSRTRSAIVLDLSKFSVGFLRNMEAVPLAKTTATEQEALEVEYTLVVGNEKAGGIMADLTTS